MRKTLILVLGGLALVNLSSPAFAGSDNCKGDTNKTKTVKKMNKITDFSFAQSGGIMGMDKRYEVRLAELESAERQKLEKLIESSGLLKFKSEQRLTRGAADMFVYQFTAKGDKKEYAATFDDGTLPDSFRPLASYLQGKAVDNRKRN